MRYRFWIAGCAVATVAGAARAQCEPTWSDQFSGSDLFGAVARASAIWDDGTGPALYVQGYFEAAGDAAVSGIAKWDGTRWTALGPGLTWTFGSGAWQSMAGVPLGGPAGGLYCKGEYATAGGQAATPISRWDGHAWTTVPGSVGGPGSRAMIGFDPDGPGPATTLLYAMNRSWDGVTWTNTGLGNVFTYAIFDDDGAGPNLPALYACGTTLTYNGQSLGSVMRLSGGAWVAVGTLAGAMEVTGWDEDGAGPLPARLHALTSSGVVQRFDGVSWSPIAASAGSSPYTIAVFDEDGPGPLAPSLLVSLEHSIKKLVTGTWASVGTLNSSFCSCAAAYSLHVFDPPGAEPEALYGTGYFTISNGTTTNGVFKWNGQGFAALSEEHGLNEAGASLRVFDEDGPGPGRSTLFVGGAFSSAGGASMSALARWNGSKWSAVGGGLSGGAYGTLVKGMTEWDDDGGGPHLPRLVVGGQFDLAGGVGAGNIAAWDGAGWSSLGTGVSGGPYATVEALVAFDDDGAGPHLPVLVAAGSFDSAGGAATPGNVAAWDGVTWTKIGNSAPPFNPVAALAVFDDDAEGPNPPRLYAGGRGGVGIYMWDGVSWLPVGGGLSRSDGTLAHALAVVDDDGAGPHRPMLWVGGQFSLAGGVPAINIARWDGHSWSPAGPGIGANNFLDQVAYITAADEDGSGVLTVYAGGFVWGAGVSNLYKWLPASAAWVSAGAGAPSAAAAAVYDDDGSGPERPAVYLTGYFLEAGGVPSANITRLACPAGCYVNCDGSTNSPILNANDFQCFLNQFAAGSGNANCDHSLIEPVLNANDFQCFLNKFAIGCP